MDYFFFVALSTLVTIVNPLGAVGPFLAMTLNSTPEKRLLIAKRASITSGAILAGCGVIGAFIFRFYGITLPAFKIAGGILLFFIAYDMVNARTSRTRQTKEEESEGVAKEDVAIFPLAIPLLSGPGAIVSMFILSDQAQTTFQMMALYGALLITTVACYVVLSQAPRLVSFLGQIGMNVMARLLGILLAASAIQFVLDGLKLAFHGLTIAGM